MLRTDQHPTNSRAPVLGERVCPCLIKREELEETLGERGEISNKEKKHATHGSSSASDEGKNIPIVRRGGNVLWWWGSFAEEKIYIVGNE